jgi:hypothetical protein
MMAYSYQRPPMYDNSINDFTLKLLNWAPLLYSGMAAWIFSNQQVFRNVFNAQSTTLLFPDADHTFEQFFTQINIGSIFFV